MVMMTVMAGRSPALAQAGAVPGGVQQELLRQQQRLEQQTAPPRQEGPGVVGPKRPTSPFLQPGGPKFALRNIVFEGDSKFLSNEELEGTIASYVGHRVDFADLQKIIAAINALYEAKGIVTGIATLPPQDVKGGIVTIKLTEGKLSKMQVTGNDQTKPWYVLERVQHPEGEVLDVPKLNRDVVWFNRTNDTQIRALLAPGTSFGLTDVNIAVTEAPRNTLQLFTDNQGVPQVGRYQYGAFYKGSGWLGIDDRFTFYGTKSVEHGGNINGNFAYNLPFNPLGGRVGVSYTQGRTHILNGPSEPLNLQGDSQIAAVNVSQPMFIVNEHWLLLGNLAGSYGVTESRTAPSMFYLSNTRTFKETAGFSLTNSGDNYSISISPAFNYGETHDAVLDIDNRYELYTGLISAYGRLPNDFSISALGSWQYTSQRNLPGDQLFQIGGPTTVRGYPTNAAPGYSGYYANLELHKNLSQYIQGLDLYAFIDRGEVYFSFPNHTLLMSAGAGFAWTVIPAVTLEAFAGAPWYHITQTDTRRYEAYFRVSVRPLLFAAQLSPPSERPN